MSPFVLDNSVTIDQDNFDLILTEVRLLAVKYGLTGYDASYLELATRKALPIATLDDDLRKAAAAAGVQLLQP